jgi:hypothetical protein
LVVEVCPAEVVVLIVGGGVIVLSWLLDVDVDVDLVETPPVVLVVVLFDGGVVLVLVLVLLSVAGTVSGKLVGLENGTV